MSFGQVFYVYWSTLCRLVNFMSFGQVLYVVWSTLCRLVKFYMSTGQLNVDLGRQTSPSQYELGSGSSAFRGTYREWLGPKSSKSKFFKVFLETTFVHVSCYPDHYEPKIFFSVFKGHTYASIHDFRLEGSPCNAISEGRPSLRNTSSEAPEARPSEARIENVPTIGTHGRL